MNEPSGLTGELRRCVTGKRTTMHLRLACTYRELLPDEDVFESTTKEDLKAAFPEAMIYIESITFPLLTQDFWIEVVDRMNIDKPEKSTEAA